MAIRVSKIHGKKASKSLLSSEKSSARWQKLSPITTIKSEYLTYRPPQTENIKKEEEIKIENYEEEDDYEQVFSYPKVECFHCGKVLSDEEEHDHSKESSGGSKYSTYKSTQIKNVKKEENMRIERKFNEINSEMNDLSSMTMDQVRSLQKTIKIMDEKITMLDKESSDIMHKVQEEFDDLESRVIDNIKKQVDAIDQITDKMSVLLPEVDQLKKEMETIQDVREELIVVQNRTTENVRILAKDVDDFSEIKLKLEERIDVIEKANLIEEKPEQEYIPEDSYPYEDIKFETEEEVEKFISKTHEKNIEIKMEIPSAPEEETEDLIKEEDLDDKEESDVEEDLEDKDYV